MTGSAKVYKVGINLGGNELIRPKLNDSVSLSASGEIGFTGANGYVKFYSGGVERAIGGTSTNALKLNEFANPDGSVNLNSQKITNLATPTVSGDAANKSYVDSVASGLDVRSSVVAATTASLPTCTYYNGIANDGVGATLTGDANGALPDQDGVTLIATNRILVKNQSAGLQNGIYTVTVVGDIDNPFVLTRATDADDSPDGEVTAGMFVFVEQGTINADSGWVLTTNNPITIGSTALAFAQFSGAGQITAGDGITKSGNTISLASSTAGNGLTYTTGVLAVGAGTGITVNSDDVAINTSVVARKHVDTTTIAGDGIVTDFVITHGLSNQWVSVTVINKSTLEDEVVDIERTNTTTCTVKFAVAPAIGQDYAVIVIG